MTLLKSKKIFITKPRVKVLKIIGIEYEDVFGVNKFLAASNSLNRISVHRTLREFVQKGILLKVPNTKGIIQYRLNDDLAKTVVR